MEPFSIQIKEIEQGSVITISGSIGVMEVDQLDAQLTRVADKKPQLVVFDLGGVSMMGSSAMGSLVGFRRDIGKSGGTVRLARVSKLVAESLRRAMFDRLFKFFDTVENALIGAGLK